jgi:hypothetical protein
LQSCSNAVAKSIDDDDVGGGGGGGGDSGNDNDNDDGDDDGTMASLLRESKPASATGA